MVIKVQEQRPRIFCHKQLRYLHCVILDMLKQCLSEIHTHLRAFDDSVEGIATMTFQQMTAFEAKSKVCIFFYLMVHSVL